MRYSNPLIAVKDMDKALAFYKVFFDQEVAVDLDWCKNLTCGVTLQLHFDRLVGFGEDTMRFHNNTMELYFETDEFDDFIALLDKHPEVERVHEVKQYEWLQRVIRIYDPDGHMIEVGESMSQIGCRLFAEGKSIAEVMELTQHPEHVVKEWYQLYLDKKA